MKREKLYFFVVLLLIVFCGVMMNLYIRHALAERQDEIAVVSANRLKHALAEYESSGSPVNAELSGYEGITGVQVLGAAEASDLEKLNTFLEDGKQKDCFFYSTGENLYRIEYERSTKKEKQMLFAANAGLAVLLVVWSFCFWRLWKNVLKPMEQMVELPYELAKGNLSIPLKKEKKGRFWHFLWGMDLLRENLEESRQKNLELQKEKKVLLMSLSHDIKTPLSAIRLYVSALEKGIYKEKEKLAQIGGKLNEKVNEIERYMAEIVHASNEDFLHFEVNNGAFYTDELFGRIRHYYNDKMLLHQIDFTISESGNCMLYGDLDRMEEVLQNLIENAIKYGDKKKISLQTCREEDSYVILVTNTGAAIEPRELPHMFDSFFRGSNVGKQPGSGLGLYICRQLMHRMEGEILAELVPDESTGQKQLQIRVIVKVA